MTRRRTPTLALSLIALTGVMILGIQTVQAQLTTATISGTVANTTGAVIPGVSVSVLHVETGTSRDAVTDDEDRYRVPLPDPIMFAAPPNPFAPGTRRGAAGSISSTISTSRQIQFALKIIF